MENTEEATVHDNGSVTIRYYYGKTVKIPTYIMEECILMAKYGVDII